jgi:hypothetical protein
MRGEALAAGDRVREEVVPALERAEGELRATAAIVEREVGSVASAFQELARHTATMLNLAAAVVDGLENAGVSSFLPQVQTLESAAQQFIADRLQATTGILETVTSEATLLGQLPHVAARQAAIAFEIKSLSVLTNIEVANLGNDGERFQYLAHELVDFSHAMIEYTRTLANQADLCRNKTEDTRCSLANEVPRLRQELARIEGDLRNALALVHAGLTKLATTPGRFRAGVEHIGGGIAGVVAAIQTQDITRQQVEHVQEAFALIAERLRGAGNSSQELARELPWTYSGLTIQIYQIKVIKQTVAHWTGQIRSCMSGIMSVSSSEVAAIAPVVLEQEQTVAAQLARIERLEGESQAYSEKIQGTLGGLFSLLQMVGENLQRSKSIRDRIRLLALNSIVEASHFGGQAAVILAISTNIKELSTLWGETTGESEHTLQEIMKLGKHRNLLMESFSAVSKVILQEAQAQTRVSLERLRVAGSFAAGQARKMKAVTEEMQGKIADVARTEERLDGCSARVDAVLSEIEGMALKMETENPDVKGQYDAAAVERLFSSSYTTELEREVLRAALEGEELPTAQTVLVGNDAELF